MIAYFGREKILFLSYHNTQFNTFSKLKLAKLRQSFKGKTDRLYRTVVVQNAAEMQQDTCWHYQHFSMIHAFVLY